MRQRLILIFTLLVFVMTFGAVLYIQSAHFAHFLKRVAQRQLPENLGIQGNFSYLKVKLFPPGVAIMKPELLAVGENPADLSIGTEVKAERLELIFRPLQIISGRVQVNDVRIVQGFVRTELKRPEKKKKKARIKLSWEEVFQVRADRLELEDTHVDLGLPDQKIRTSFNARKLEIEKKKDGPRAYYEAFLYMDAIKAEVPAGWQYPDQVDSLRAHLQLDKDALSLRSFELVREGTQFLAQGSVLGDVLSGSDLKADLNLELSADLGRMLEFVTSKKRGQKSSYELPSGHVNFKGSVRAQLDRPQETLQANGILKGERVSYSQYHFEKVEVEGLYSGRSAGGEVQVKRAVFESPQASKQGGFRPGSGGRVEIGAFKFSSENPQPIQTELRLDRAHIHWLGAIALKEIYPLDGRISGDAVLKYTPAAGPKDGFRLEAELKWRVTDFLLDNQRWKKEKPLSRVLAIPAFNLDGKVIVKNDEVVFDGPLLSMERSQLRVGGRVRYADRTQFEIEAGGSVDLSELTVLAEKKIAGQGLLGVHVSGPSDRVLLDFDGDIRDMVYLGLKFGDFQGRITWDDAPSILHFRQLKCIRNQTRYSLEGQLNLGDEETMDLRAKIPQGGNVLDFNGIFSDLVSGLWWYPAKVSGPMTGEIRVQGGIALDQMKIDGTLRGTNWDLHGERFQSVTLNGGYDRGRYFLSDSRLQKRTGALLGRVSYDPERLMSWDVRTEGFTVTDFDLIARLDVPIRGKIVGRSQGEGPEGNVESLTEIQVLDSTVRGKRIPPSQFSILSEKGIATVQGSASGGQATLDMRYALTDGKPSSLRLEARNFDFTPGVMLLNPSLIEDERIQGLVSGVFELHFLSGQSEMGSGYGRLNQYLLSREGSQFTLEKPIEFRVDGGSFEVPMLTLMGPTGRVSAKARSQAGQLSGTVQGSLDLGIVEFLTPVIEHARGQASLEYRIAGTLKKPELNGSTLLRNASVKIRALESPIENVEGKIDFRQGLLRVMDLQGDLAGGRVRAEGTLDFYLDRFPKMNIEAVLSGNRLKVYPFQVAKVRGSLFAKGESLPYLVTGRILVENALSREKIADSRSPGLRTAQYTPPPRSNVTADLPLFNLDIDVSAPGNVIIQNELIDVEAKGDLKILGTLENPIPRGIAQAVQGRVIFKDRSFAIQSGKVDFDKMTSLDPRFDVIASTEINNKKIQMVATGRFSQPKIEFSSNPPMPENEILTLLALGTSSEDSRRLRNVDRSAYEQGEAASLVLHSLDFNREVQNKTGLQIGIDEAVDAQTGQSMFRRNVDETTAAGPKIVIRRRFGNRLNLSVGSTVGVGNSVQREVNAEVSVTRGLSVLGVWDTFGGTNADDARRSSYGVDLKVQKRFK